MRRTKAHGRRGPERLRDVTQTEGHTGPVTATGTHAGRTVRAPSLVSAPPAQVRVGLPEAADKDGLRVDRLRSPAGDEFAGPNRLGQCRLAVRCHARGARPAAGPGPGGWGPVAPPASEVRPS